MALSGLALPAIRTAGGYFATKRGIDAAWGDLIIAILTPIGTRWMRRRFGSALPGAIFDPVDSTLVGEVRHYITDAATQYVPSLRILSVDVQVDHKVISVGVSFTMSNESLQATPQSRLLRLDRRNVIQFLSARSK